MIVKAAAGKPLGQTSVLLDAKKKGKDECLQVVDSAAKVAASAAEDIFNKFKVNHGDLNAGNVLFNDAVSFRSPLGINYGVLILVFRLLRLS